MAPAVASARAQIESCLIAMASRSRSRGRGPVGSDGGVVRRGCGSRRERDDVMGWTALGCGRLCAGEERVEPRERGGGDDDEDDEEAESERGRGRLRRGPSLPASPSVAFSEPAESGVVARSMMRSHTGPRVSEPGTGCPPSLARYGRAGGEAEPSSTVDASDLESESSAGERGLRRAASRASRASFVRRADSSRASLARS